jgi:hypothetical protein
MRKNSLVIYILAIVVCMGFLGTKEVLSADTAASGAVKAITNRFFKALSEGDLTAVKGSMSDKLYDKYQKLLDENSEYAEFVRSYYHQAEFKITKVLQSDEDMTVSMDIKFADGSRSSVSMLFRNYNGIWKINELGSGEDLHLTGTRGFKE